MASGLDETGLMPAPVCICRLEDIANPSHVGSLESDGGWIRVIVSACKASKRGCRKPKGGRSMAGETIGIQEYLQSYIPALVGKRLAEKPVLDMEGTTFSLQVTIKGEKSLVFGITIKDAKEVSVIEGGIDSPVLEVILSEDFVQPLVDLASSFTGRKQYDSVSQVKGTVDLEVGMPGDWSMPVSAVFNGASQPSLKLAGSSADLAKIAAGELNGPTAFMQGKIKMEGDMAFGLSLGTIFM
jgi:predicted lipid carrier protein YhbT